MNKSIQVTRSSMPDLEEYIEEIKELWESHWITNMGVKHKQLENELLKYLDASNITLFTNGHIALEYVIEAFNLTGEVITYLYICIYNACDSKKWFRTSIL